MKIACLQLSSELGAFDANVARANALLSKLPPEQVDILVLPELAFSGYNFPSLDAISPFLEKTASGPSAHWARQTAKRLRCIVTVGYPELCCDDDVDAAGTLTRPPGAASGVPRRYNSTVTVSPEGEIIAHYRKSFLYDTDNTWASEGAGFYAGSIRPSLLARQKRSRPELPGELFDAKGVEADLPDVRVAAGICMDINPYKFEAAWDEFEFARHCTQHGTDLVLLSMAWSSHTLHPEEVTGLQGQQPDLHTVGYWIERFRPLIAQDKQVLLVFANRSGVEGETVYVGTSCVARIGRGTVNIFDMLGKGDERLLVIDTDAPPKFSARLDARKDAQDATGPGPDDLKPDEPANV